LFFKPDRCQLNSIHTGTLQGAVVRVFSGMMSMRWRRHSFGESEGGTGN